MIFKPTELPGAFVIELERHEDARGYFARTFCEAEFAAHGLETRVAQCSVSFNRRKGTLRGMHYQVSPLEEVKLVRCCRGAIFDVIIDLRRDSPAFKGHFAVQLDERSGKMLYVPAGMAHGFQTLEDGTEVFYQMSQDYSAEHSRGVRWDDPVFGISWPEAERTILERDQSYPDFI
ncbi:MAG TPA: dTDP-4-dehydrorhamnose 3,5-epimerase [Candidatus Acidoferrum sp.]